MTELDNKDNLHDEALRKIGRNVVNFQKIEALLKVLVLYSSVDFQTRDNEVTHSLNEKSIRNRSLGEAASKFLKNLFKNRVAENEELDCSELHISIRFYLDMDAEDVAKEKVELERLVSERNQLIHKDLASIDFNCVNSCRKLILKLDEQNSRVLDKLNQLKDIWETFNQMQKELLTYFQSDELLAALIEAKIGT
ncbi:hypothetical protein CW740_08835 [Kangiella profundi]|uniref:Uncharacterized protein n=1 Tax=Kangiella profundi TaxID=1561924 RepID=A0A2K9AK71_9GAMM|nr:hypothetical protein [Kangiella profundi]AUD79344.1 hypothetical protein CW740_08835 [Kangiella profundi]GGE99386.1 hypothetical protein GCM10011356_11390 [Kangiella profundi]